MTSFEVKAGTVGLGGGRFDQPRTFTPFVPASRSSHEISAVPAGASVQSTLSASAPAFQAGAPLAQQASVNPSSGTVMMGDSSQKSTRVCRHFQRGRCTWGEHCRFVHEHLPPEPTVPATFPEPSWQHSTSAATTASQSTQGKSHYEQDRALTIGVQQSRLQSMRHAKLHAALKGTYEIFPSDTPGHVTITIPGHEPDTVAFLGESQMQAELRRIEKDDRFQAGGLMFLAGEPSVFYTGVRMFNTQGSCGSKKLDFLLNMAQIHDMVECMFYASPAGCQTPSCSYEHRSLCQAAREGTLGKPIPPGCSFKAPATTIVSPSPQISEPTNVLQHPTPFSLGTTMAPSASTVSPKLTYGLSPNASLTSNPLGPTTTTSSKLGSLDDVSFFSQESPILQSRKPASTSDLSQWDSVVQTLQKKQQPKPPVPAVSLPASTLTSLPVDEGKAIW